MTKRESMAREILPLLTDDKARQQFAEYVARAEADAAISYREMRQHWRYTFAAAALTGVVATFIGDTRTAHSRLDMWAEDAQRIADEMLLALESHPLPEKKP